MPDPNADKISILMVDDKPQQLLALEAILEDARLNIVRAYSGGEALRKLLQQEFAVILLDVNMPGMDGFETASLIRQRQATRDVPILFVTAFGDDAQIARGYNLGAVDYVLTPVVPEVLRTKVNVFVDLFRKTEQVKRQADTLRRRAAQLQKLTAASLAINSALSIERMLQTVTDTAREVVGSHQAITLFIVDPGNKDHLPRTECVASFSDRYADWRGQRLQLDAIARSMVARSKTATRMSESELRDHPDWEIVKGLKIPPVQGGMMAVPLSGRAGNNLGVIYLADRFEGEFTSDDEAVLVQLAQMASVAIENTIYAQEREANRIKDEFLSTLSHELRTPLNAILGWTQLLQTEEEKDAITHGLEVVERNARAQAKLIEDLLDVSRISTGKLRIATRPIEIGPIVASAIEVVRPIAAEKGVELACNTQDSANDARVAADPDRLQQVFWNILSNAVKFTDKGGRIEVILERVNAHLRVRISDTGRGIPPAFLPYVFDRFRQADSSSTRSHGGLGIGLAIVRHIVELHGGAVRADSPGDGQGSTFTVSLPALDSALVAPSGSLNGNGAADAPADSLAGTTVLVVDDEPDAREMLAVLLGRAGAGVTQCTCVTEALDCFTKYRPDVIVSDLAMPDRDGFELARAIRELPASAGGAVGLIALSAYAREEDRIASLSAGFHMHVAKPVDPAALIGAVRHVAKSRAATPVA